MRVYKVICRIGELSVGDVITKIGGEKQYTIRDKITIWDGGDNKTIPTHKGCMFLVSFGAEANIQAVGPDLEVIWLATAEDLYRLLRDTSHLVS